MVDVTSKIMAFLFVGLLFSVPAWAAYSIVDDVTGGACTTIGTWNAGTKTCTLNTDVTEQIQIGSSGIVLDGNGHSVTGSSAGVSASRVTGIVVKNLKVSGATNGIFLNGNYNNITGNEIVNCGTGISLSSANDNLIFENNVSSNNYGIYFWSSSFNRVYRNTLASNTYGLYLNGAADNVVYNNDFLGNTNQIIYSGYASNTYNLAAPVGGNYFSDWNSPDTDANGFVDSPYTFSGGLDNLPWATMTGWDSAPVDADEDGYDETVDCNDNNSTINPNATETCDGIDNNCDGKVDGIDADEDSYTGICGDCNDTNSTINPGATESCDGVDNDCDGTVDEECDECSDDEDGDGINNCEDKCPGTETEGAAWKRLLNKRFADVDNDGIFETRKKKKASIIDSKYSFEDTLGCSCEQILEYMPGKNKGMMSFGCTRSIMNAWTHKKGWAKKYDFEWKGKFNKWKGDHKEWKWNHKGNNGDSEKCDDDE
ncbi:MAG: hypothetical protein GOV00_01230 [Candidatus Altiarchaeota archaeon]|nr:hypothetical protein [Candidatus Altiarchaeota archaeon]